MCTHISIYTFSRRACSRILLDFFHVLVLEPCKVDHKLNLDEGILYLCREIGFGDSPLELHEDVEFCLGKTAMSNLS